MPHETSHRSLDDVRAIAARYARNAQIADIQPLGNGNINDTFLVTQHSTAKPFVLQRINTQVFRQPHLVVQNTRICTTHMRDRMERQPLSRRWEVPEVLLTEDRRDRWEDEKGGCWRAMSYIEATETFDTIPTIACAAEVGYALGLFHRTVGDLPPEHLADTLEGFHITPRYLLQHETLLAGTAIADSAIVNSPEVKFGLQFVRDRRDLAPVLEEAKARGDIPLRLMHGDPKVNNILFDCRTQKAVSIIDLDTVKPGLVHYDIGDCLRSGCNPLGEETADWECVHFDLDLCRGLLQGYFAEARAFFTASDYAYLFDAMRLLAFELGLRFLTDHLAGNVYFKTNYPDHNLVRALVQFQLARSIESQEPDIRALIRDCL